MLDHQKRSVYLPIAVLVGLAAATATLPAGQSGEGWPRAGAIVLTLGAALRLPRLALAPAAALIWAISNLVGSELFEAPAFTAVSGIELAGLLGLAGAASLTWSGVRRLEAESRADTDPETGVLNERYLRDTIEQEIARSRRFDREFSLMLVGVDWRRLRFDYRDEKDWRAAFQATASLLGNTRANIDRVFRYGERAFALVLPETGPADVTGMISRLNRLARSCDPAESERGGPLPTNIGVTFFPRAATGADDLLRRAEVALRLAEKSPTRVKFDGAEAPDLPAPASLRKDPAQGEGTDEPPPTPRPLAHPEQAKTQAEIGLVPALQGPRIDSYSEETADPWSSPIEGDCQALGPQYQAGPAPTPLLRPTVRDLLRHLDDTLAAIEELKSA